MKVQSVDVILERIDIATERSPIAVFYAQNDGALGLAAVFASTVDTQRKIKTGCSELVGVFNQTENRYDTKKFLKKALANIKRL